MHEAYNKDPTEEGLKELRQMHETLCLLFKQAPEMLLNVIPHFAEVLQGGSLILRLLATQTLGSIFGSPASSLIASAGHQTIAETYHSTWQIWAARRADKSVGIRVAWVDSASQVLVHQPELRETVEGMWCSFRSFSLADRPVLHLMKAALVEKLTDVEDKVRAAACKAFGSLDYEIAAQHIKAETLRLLADRLKDKRVCTLQLCYDKGLLST
jgi:sister-chromatid-cohesion protein PDS5